MQKQCPNCKSYNTMSVKGLGATVFFVLFFLTGFLGLFIFPFLLVALFFLVAGIIVAIVPQDKRGKKEYSCLNCHYKWKEDKGKVIS